MAIELNFSNFDFDEQQSTFFPQDDTFIDFNEFNPIEDFLQTETSKIVQVILENDQSKEKYCFNDIQLNLTQNQTLTLQELLSKTNCNNLTLKNSKYFLWDYSQNMFIFLSTTGPNEDIEIPKGCYQEDKIHMKYLHNQEYPQQQQNDLLTFQEDNKVEVKRLRKQSTSSNNSKRKQRRQSEYKRVKERVIEDAVQLVSDWRDIYHNGYYDSNNQYHRAKNFEQAANMLQVSRKTLDDYYCVIRKAKQFGFNFDENKHKKMRVLRDFVKLQEKNSDSASLSSKSESKFDVQSQISTSDFQESSKEIYEDNGSNMSFEGFTFQA